VCWPFHGADHAADLARVFVADGLARGERVVFCGHGGPEELRQDLVGIDGLADLVVREQLLLLDVDSLPGTQPAQHPATELQLIAAMTREALAAGHVGLRVVIDGSSRVADPLRREQYVYYEHLLDLFCLTEACTWVCLFDTDVLGDDVVRELACVHSFTYGNSAPFQLRASRDADFSLTGAVDHFSAHCFTEVLRRITEHTGEDHLVIDATCLEFVDHRALVELERYAEEHDATVVLRSASRVIARLSEVLDLSRVSIQPT